MADSTNVEIQAYLTAASQEIWQVAQLALMRDGKTAALAAMRSIAEGRAFVEVEVRFTRLGVAFDVSFCSHGGRSNLFSATLKGAHESDAPNGPPVEP